MTMKRRVVFDCNTLLQALSSPSGAAGACVQLVLDGDVELFLSELVIAELRDVATRPRVMRKLQLTHARIAAFVEAITAVGVSIEGIAEVFVYQRDPDDAHYVNLALAAMRS
jgi:putative PIN family toxin of toxin-antitoxin system